MTVTDWILLGAAAGVAVPIGVVALEVAAALGGRGRADAHARPCAGEGLAGLNGVGAEHSAGGRGRVAVLMPAHNEEGAIGEALAAIMPQLVEGDRALVVADNCTDGTAAKAAAAGARVIERRDEARRGKGFALAAGIEALRADAPAVVIVVDADMTLGPGSVEVLAQAVERHGVAAQALDLLEPPRGADVRLWISALAFAFKNHVRAVGADRLGVPCLLRGTGMALPWRTVAGLKLATGNLVEDMAMSVELALAGEAPRFCPEARVSGRLSGAVSTSRVQRTRWEHGHLQTILRHVPGLLWRGVTRARPSLIGLALDLAVPPLALLCMLWCVLTLFAGTLWATHLASVWPVLVLMVAGVLLAGSVLAGWAVYGRRTVPLRALLAIPFYIIWKLPLYLAFVWKRQQSWIRTERPA